MWCAESDEDALAMAGQYWVNVLSNMTKQKDVLEFRYEDFCKDVHGHLRKVLDYVGLSTEKFPFDKVPKQLTVTNQKRLDKISSAEMRELEKIQGSYLKKFGYLK